MYSDLPPFIGGGYAIYTVEGLLCKSLLFSACLLEHLWGLVNYTVATLPCNLSGENCKINQSSRRGAVNDKAEWVRDRAEVEKQGAGRGKMARSRVWAGSLVRRVWGGGGVSRQRK